MMRTLNYSHATSASLAAALLDARSRTLALVEDLDHQQLIGERRPTINPLRWEIAHVAYFHELWILRHLAGQAPMDKRSDALFDSIRVQHKDRWHLPLPDLHATFRYMDDVLQRELELLDNIELTQRVKYFYLLALFHEDMHYEAFIYTRQTLAYPKPVFIPDEDDDKKETAVSSEDIEIDGGVFKLGAQRGDEFVFDNEKWAHEIHVAPFKIASCAVSNEQYLEFVEAGGYQKRQYWTESSWDDRKQQNLEHPVYWKREAQHKWYVRSFDQWIPMQADHAVSHVSWHEAQAFCRWARRRLPTEAEWEFAASCHPDASEANHEQKRIFPYTQDTDRCYANLDCVRAGTTAVHDFDESANAFGCRQMFGNVWEWTASSFDPYPGFSPDWYTEYSRPLFHKTKVLRGGAWPTRSRMLRTTLRNYYGPERNDVFAGFRTCTL